MNHSDPTRYMAAHRVPLIVQKGDKAYSSFRAHNARAATVMPMLCGQKGTIS